MKRSRCLSTSEFVLILLFLTFSCQYLFAHNPEGYRKAALILSISGIIVSSLFKALVLISLPQRSHPIPKILLACLSVFEIGLFFGCVELAIWLWKDTNPIFNFMYGGLLLMIPEIPINLFLLRRFNAFNSNRLQRLIGFALSVCYPILNIVLVWEGVPVVSELF